MIYKQQKITSLEKALSLGIFSQLFLAWQSGDICFQEICGRSWKIFIPGPKIHFLMFCCQETSKWEINITKEVEGKHIIQSQSSQNLFQNIWPDQPQTRRKCIHSPPDGEDNQGQWWVWWASLFLPATLSPQVRSKETFQFCRHYPTSTCLSTHTHGWYWSYT